jgi:hypothetical protein
MKAVRISHVREAERLAQASAAEMIGAALYHDAAGNTWAVSDTGQMFRRDAAVEIMAVPSGWVQGPSDPIGGWREEGADD